MKEYKYLTSEEKCRMFWPKGSKVRRLNSNENFDPNEIYELLYDKDYDSSTVTIAKNKHGNKDGGRDSEYFELVSLPGEEQEIINTYPIY